jgi:hypothetical protein
MLPAAEGWQPPVTAPKTATWVQLGYPPQGYRKDLPIVIAHWASDMSGEEQPGYEGWFRDNLGHGGRSSGFVEVPTGWVAWRPLWPRQDAEFAALRDVVAAARPYRGNGNINAALVALDALHPAAPAAPAPVEPPGKPQQDGMVNFGTLVVAEGAPLQIRQPTWPVSMPMAVWLNARGQYLLAAPGSPADMPAQAGWERRGVTVLSVALGSAEGTT